MPFLLYTSDGKQVRLDGTTSYQSVVLKGAKSFLIASGQRYPKNISKNSLTYFETTHDNCSAVVETSGKRKRRSVGHYNDALKAGTWRDYYQGDTLKQIARYINGKLDGGVVCFSPDGMKRSSMFYVQDTLEGAVNLYYENGKPELTGNFTNGNPDGE
jgi:antitoxin component YwqK of YwqJK toxin-antitoxin module